MAPDAPFAIPGRSLRYRANSLIRGDIHSHRDGAVSDGRPAEGREGRMPRARQTRMDTERKPSLGFVVRPFSHFGKLRRSRMNTGWNRDWRAKNAKNKRMFFLKNEAKKLLKTLGNRRSSQKNEPKNRGSC